MMIMHKKSLGIFNVWPVHVKHSQFTFTAYCSNTKKHRIAVNSENILVEVIIQSKTKGNYLCG